MGTRKVEIGPTGKTVQANVAEIRSRRGLTLRDLSEKMTAVGWPMAHNTINEIERGGRRCDVDDLVALAAALEVSSTDLLGVSDTQEFSPTASLIVDMLRQMEREKAATVDGTG